MWWRAFKSTLEQQSQECGLLMTEPPFNLPSIQTSTMQVRSEHCQQVTQGQCPKKWLPLEFRSVLRQQCALSHRISCFGCTKAYNLAAQLVSCHPSSHWTALCPAGMSGKARGQKGCLKGLYGPLKPEFLGMQMVFEEYGFKSFLAMPAQPLSLLEWQAQRPSLLASSAGIGVVVDAGASHIPCICTVTPSAVPKPSSSQVH